MNKEEKIKRLKILIVSLKARLTAAEELGDNFQDQVEALSSDMNAKLAQLNALQTEEEKEEEKEEG